MNRRIVFVVFASALLLSLIAAWSSAGPNGIGDDRGYSPEQPIAFSHALHAGEMKIACLHCHFGADRSRHAGIPGPGLCMDCHKFVGARIGAVRAEEKRAELEGRKPEPVVSPEIAKIWASLGLGRDQKPVSGAEAAGIDWVRVHRVADFVYFDHGRHSHAGVDCSACHGAVETMERVRQVEHFSMGFCVNCHRSVGEAGGTTTVRCEPGIDCGLCHQ